MEELNLGEMASWIARVENKFRSLANTSYSIVDTFECRKLVSRKRNGGKDNPVK